MILDATNEVTNPNGNRPQDPNAVIGVAIHYTVTDPNGPATPDAEATEAQERAHIRAIDQYHVSLDYGGFAYNGIAFASGRAYYCGRGRRAHVALRNHELRGYVFCGTFTDEQPTDAAFGAMRELLQADRDQFGPKPIKGHREWALPGHGTACPGVIVPRDWEAFMAPPAPPPAQPYVTYTKVGFSDGTEWYVEAVAPPL